MDLFHNRVNSPKESVLWMYLEEHFLEVILWADPGRNGITEEDEILNDSVRIDIYHRTDATERRVLLLVVSDVTQRCAPVCNKALQSKYRNVTKIEGSVNLHGSTRRSKQHTRNTPVYL